jgi:hypothetical protein
MRKLNFEVHNAQSLSIGRMVSLFWVADMKPLKFFNKGYIQAGDIEHNFLKVESRSE